MNLAFAYGIFSSAFHGKFDPDTLYTDGGFLTGSESYFWNTVWGLSERGHRCTAFCDLKGGPRDKVASLAGAAVRDLPLIFQWKDQYDAVISWNEPEYLRYAPPSALRVCCQQLNDFGYTFPDYDKLVEVYVSPSEHHRSYLTKACRLDPLKFEALENCTNVEFFRHGRDPSPEELADVTAVELAWYQQALIRDPHRIVYTSSPDRGLIHLLTIWPQIRAAVPDATLRIYYRLQQWIDNQKANKAPWGEVWKHLAAQFEEILPTLEGVTVMGATPNRVMAARELPAARALVYPCDTLAYTEGFGVSILDALAAGCEAVISDVDALGSVYGNVATVIPGRPSKQLGKWAETVVDLLRSTPGPASPARAAFVAQHSRHASAQRWEAMLERRVAQKHRPKSRIMRSWT